VIYADKDGLCQGFQFIDANNRVLLREGEDSKKDGQQQFVTELNEGERVIGHVWREDENQDDFDMQFILATLK